MTDQTLTLYQTNDGIEVVINQDIGETFATQAGYARMSGISKQAVNKRCKGLTKLPFDERQSLSGSESERVNRNYILQGKVDTSQGLQSCLLIPESTTLDWLEQDNPSLLKKFSQLGLRATLHKWAGFNVESSATQTQVPQNYVEALRAAADAEEARLQAEAERQQAQAQLEDAEGKLTVYRSVLSSEACLPVKSLADSLAIKGMGRNKMFKFLRRIGLVCRNDTTPLRKQVEEGRAVSHPYTVETGNGPVTKSQTRLTFKGIEYTIKKLEGAGYQVDKSAVEVWEEHQTINN